MVYGQTLIDKAGKVCGSFYKLSKETGFAQSTLSEIRAGKRKLPPEWVPVLAEIAGVNARDALAEVVAEQMPEGCRGRAILGGVKAVGAAAMLLFFAVPGLLMPLNSYAGSTGLPLAGEHPIHRGRLRRALKRLLSGKSNTDTPGKDTPIGGLGFL